MPRPDQNAYVEALLGIKLDHYDTKKLRERYKILGARVAKELREGSDQDGPWVYLVRNLKFNMHTERSKVIDAAFAELEHAKDLNVQSAKLRDLNADLSGLEHRALQLFQTRVSKESKAPTAMENAVVAGDMTVKQIKHFAEAAQKAWEDFENAHTTLFAIIDSVNQTYKDLQPIRNIINLGKDYMSFAERLPVEQAAAAASSALGPIGPIAGTLAIIAELYSLFMRFLAVLGDLIDLLTKMVGGKPMTSEALKGVEDVVQKLQDVQKILTSIRDRCTPLRKPSKVVEALLKAKK